MDDAYGQRGFNVQNKIGSKSCKWSSLNDPGTGKSLSQPILGLGELSIPPRVNLDRLRTDVNRHFSIARHRKRHSDVVNEIDIVPAGGTIEMLINLGNFAR